MFHLPALERACWGSGNHLGRGQGEFKKKAGCPSCSSAAALMDSGQLVQRKPTSREGAQWEGAKAEAEVQSWLCCWDPRSSHQVLSLEPSKIQFHCLSINSPKTRLCLSLTAFIPSIELQDWSSSLAFSVHFSASEKIKKKKKAATLKLLGIRSLFF